MDTESMFVFVAVGCLCPVLASGEASGGGGGGGQQERTSLIASDPRLWLQLEVL